MLEPAQIEPGRRSGGRGETRRAFIKQIAAVTGSALVAPVLWSGFSAAGSIAVRRDPWERVPEILARIQPPEFPPRDYPITQFGAVGDGETDASEAIALAVKACNDAGGGRVVVGDGSRGTCS